VAGEGQGGVHCARVRNAHPESLREPLGIFDVGGLCDEGGGLDLVVVAGSRAKTLLASPALSSRLMES
jgi:hypothetical protein